MRTPEPFIHGLPHVGARYTGGWSGKRLAYERIAEACPSCDCARAAETHHIDPIGMGGHQAPRFLCSKLGTFELYTPLIALCSGCHRMFHDGVFSIAWLWDDEEAARLWAEGWFMAHYAPHDPALYEFGCWVMSTGKEIRQ